MKIYIIFFLLLVLSGSGLNAQSNVSLSNISNNQLLDGAQELIAKSPEFSIPVSPAFDLLGVNPSLVPKPSTIRDFKVDWSFKSYGLSPNLAIQAQPFWEIYFNSPKKMSRYKTAPNWLKFMSTLDVSAGTIEGNSDIRTSEILIKNSEGNDSLVTVDKNWKVRSFAYALKINLYKERDPLENTKLFTALLKEYEESKNKLKNQIKELKIRVEKFQDIEDRINLKDQLKETENQFNNIEITYIDKIKKKADLYKKESWNTSYVDLAVGQSFDFDSRDSSLFTFKNLHLINKRLSVWLSGSKGVGKNWLFSGLIRINSYNNKLTDKTQFNIDLGTNIRYGNSVYNFFIEAYIPFYFEKQPGEIMNFSYGGDWRVSRNVILNYGLRSQIDEKLKLVNILPVVSVSCMMR